MQDEWIQIADGYSINVDGYVRNDSTRELLKRSYNASGSPSVSFRIDGRLTRRQVTSYMAVTWMGPGPNMYCDTPMHLDGNRDNCHVNNLVFRPRWFVREYHKECIDDLYPGWDRPFFIIDTGEIFMTPRECAMSNGFLQKDIIRVLLYDYPRLFPGGFQLEFL